MTRLNTVFLALAISTALGGCAAKNTQNVSPYFNYNKDVSIGLEAESIGNYSLARDFLEHALEKDNAYRAKVVFEDDPVLTDKSRQAALEALSRIYYSTGDLKSLYEHLHEYWRVSDLAGVPWVSENELKGNYEYHLNWYCRLLDDQERFSDAQACWAQLGNVTRAAASIRAFEMQEVFGH